MQKSLVCPPALVDEALLVVDEASEGAGDGERGVLALEDEPAALPADAERLGATRCHLDIGARKELAHANSRVAVRGSKRPRIGRGRKICVFCAKFTCNRLPPITTERLRDKPSVKGGPSYFLLPL